MDLLKEIPDSVGAGLMVIGIFVLVPLVLKVNAREPGFGVH